jgi:hypothetical protein
METDLMRTSNTLAAWLLRPFRKIATWGGWVGGRLFCVVELLYHLRVEVCGLEGEELNSGQPIRVLCGLRGPTKNYAIQLIFGDKYREQSLGRFWIWNLAKAIQAMGGRCDMILAWACTPYLKFASASDWFLIPDWVWGEVSLPRDADALHRVNGDIRRIRSRGLSFEITHDPAKFDDFYYNMHVPYITKTFDKSAYVLPYKTLKEEFLYSDLILINRGEQSIAGQLIWYFDDGPFLESMGIRDGDREHVKNGASCALYHYGLEYLQEKGFSKAIVGWSRPFLHNGVLNFKRKWSQVITHARWWGFGLKVLSSSAAVKSFLCHNPFIYKGRGGLYGAAFVDGDQSLSAETIEQLTADYLHAGLAGLEIYHLSPEDAATPPPTQVELPERVALRAWPR